MVPYHLMATRLVLIALLALLLTSHFFPAGALARHTQREELQPVGRWAYGPAYAVTSLEIDSTPYALLGSGGAVLVLDLTDPANPTKVGEIVTPGIVYVRLHLDLAYRFFR